MERYLRGRSIKFHVIPGYPGDRHDQDRVKDRTRIADAEVESTIPAHVEPAFVDWVFSGEVIVYFFFDDHSRLIGYSFHYVVDAP